MIDETLTISKSKVLEAMDKCPDAKRILETIFGEQVGSWEEVSLSKCYISTFKEERDWTLVVPGLGRAGANGWAFMLVKNKESDYCDRVKIENGKIFRRKT